MATTEHITREETTTPAVRPDPCSAVLYVCAERGIYLPELPAARAEEEGRAYAWTRGWRVAEVIHDPTTEDPEPLHRTGWRRVRTLAAAGTAATVIVRWPAVIAPDSAADLRHRETRWLQERGVQVRYSWEPLAQQETRRG
ncbi:MULTISPECIES: hypothetical protein [Streptomyces]|uniref:Resolvase/invertase-type recombinase catalytic domain-containing protein n=1 Tax=Streptomyces canarius TaxID=285453 RepID=A0ABQ3DD19_9ACTN|nr:hypothetical protein [Streptomyces canarius]GHA73037.1 hypothetical protein GCM10010345_89830 [Streptomyces canarius]